MCLSTCRRILSIEGHGRRQPDGNGKQSGSNGKQNHAAVLQFAVTQILEEDECSSWPQKTGRKDRPYFVIAL